MDLNPSGDPEPRAWRRSLKAGQCAALPGLERLECPQLQELNLFGNRNFEMAGVEGVGLAGCDLPGSCAVMGLCSSTLWQLLIPNSRVWRARELCPTRAHTLEGLWRVMWLANGGSTG